MEQIKETSLKFSESPLCPIAADVISDGESIYFYMYDLDSYRDELRGFYLDIYHELPGEVIEDETILLNKIEMNDFNFDKLTKFNQRFNNHEDGNASKRVLDILFK